MAINFSNVASNFAKLNQTLLSNGVAQAALPNVMSQISSIFGSSNPNKSEELALLNQLIAASANPAAAAAIEGKLITENGLPPAAAAIILKMSTPGADVTTLALQAQQIINAS